MSSIVTITFSPCIDKTTTIPALIPEKKLQCTVPKLEPGGGGVNVARALKKLGENAIAVFPSGGYTGKFFNHLIASYQVCSRIIETQNETRENIIVFDQTAKCQYRFGMPGTFLNEEEWRNCLKVVEEIDHIDFLVASGSLPPGVPTDIYAILAGIAADKKAKFIVDASGEALKKVAEKGVYLLKPNLGEFAYLAGVKQIDRAEVPVVARNLIARGMCEVMIVSMGLHGAVFATGDEWGIIHAPLVEIKSTVGAGDSMLAGIIYFLSKGKSIEEAARYGVACGTAATMNPGTALCKKQDADDLYKIISAGILQK